MSKVKRSQVITALNKLHPDNLDEIAKLHGVSHAMKYRSDQVKVIMNYDLNGE